MKKFEVYKSYVTLKTKYHFGN